MLAASPEKTELSIAFWTEICRNNDMKAAEIESIYCKSTEEIRLGYGMDKVNLVF